jgi:TfoX/Sxy family transcriptional regulator of competence genes
MPKGASSPHQDKVALIEKLVANHAGIELKGDTMPYTAVNGNMFSVMGKDGKFVLRLSDDDRAAFVAKYKTKPVVMYGALMKEYVEIPDALLAKTAELRKYFAASYAFVASLKPKATTKKSAKKKKK